MGNFGTTEIILILLLVLVFFGSKKIPELAQGLGRGIRDFRKAMKEGDDESRTDDQRKIEEKKPQ
ncbi:MAG: twin-arginine translocase TatA/TatE family subunit [Ignavibacteriales bacterium CG07_land_8_20_14_0_80_59_12]|nr:MAG: twin-arginine translocase TatA/TatE family subunit [Ignavibacteriales bacterium CG07_land_8_20_14_0_80_59_12]